MARALAPSRASPPPSPTTPVTRAHLFTGEVGHAVPQAGVEGGRAFGGRVGGHGGQNGVRERVRVCGSSVPQAESGACVEKVARACRCVWGRAAASGRGKNAATERIGVYVAGCRKNKKKTAQSFWGLALDVPLPAVVTRHSGLAHPLSHAGSPPPPHTHTPTHPHTITNGRRVGRPAGRRADCTGGARSRHGHGHGEWLVPTVGRLA